LFFGTFIHALPFSGTQYQTGTHTPQSVLNHQNNRQPPALDTSAARDILNEPTSSYPPPHVRIMVWCRICTLLFICKWMCL